MSNTFSFYSSTSQLKGAKGAAGLLCELAPDSPALEDVEPRYGPGELLGSRDEALQIAHSVVSKLLRSAPVIEGLPLLSIFEEALLEEFSYIAQAFYLDRWIRTQRVSTCRFISHSPWLDRLRQVRAITGSGYELTADVSPLPKNSGVQVIRKLRSLRPTAWEILRRISPHCSRMLSGVSERGHARKTANGGAWFYSNAYTFTKIGLAYEPYIPEKLNFLVEDPATGGKALREQGRDFYSVYAWSRASDIPSNIETREIGNKVLAAIEATPLSHDENLLRSAFLNSACWSGFLTRDLPFILFNGRALERWSRAVKPELLVVGNAGDERVLLMRESVKSVPVVMLQHGIMHWVYGVADQPVDAFLLRGAFFQRGINHELRSKSLVLNVPQPALQEHESAREDILFITAPYEILPFFHREDRLDILRSLLRVSSATRRCLALRVHPMEKIAAYKKEIGQLQAELGLSANISYSQGPGAEQLLARSRVAVLFFSTMFLDCLRHRIPIISFDWHWFANKRQFAEEGIFNFASDLAHFENLLWQGIEGRLPQRSGGIEDFLAPTQPEEIARFFQQIRHGSRATSSST
jgi:hypothetical protein